MHMIVCICKGGRACARPRLPDGRNQLSAGILFDEKTIDRACCMTTAATLTSNGRTTIPKEIRDGLDMKPGDRMTFTLMPDRTVQIRVNSRRSKKTTRIADVAKEKPQ